jgi:tetratricopeptide (TPR) repeat protein
VRWLAQLPAPLPAPPPRAERGLVEAQAQLAFGDLDGARRSLASLIDVAPSSGAYRLLASVERRARRSEAAAAALERAEALGRAELARVLCERARLLLDTDQRAQALACFEEAHRVDPALPDALVGLGSLALHAGDPAQGERHFRHALELEKSARTLCGLGLAQSAGGQARQALETLERALDLDPDCLSAVCGLVEAAYRTGELAVAERRARAYVELHSGDLDMSFALAGLRCQLGDRAGAGELLERIELFDPAYAGLAELRAKLQAL